ncbi:MAG TPA: AarF/ABC1/UbiB kinase family protein, partial [Candidatus Acidoferrum sp.]|nr:AarF/ABC1/UbiB kinase family protein [Candidatus Acidoferrum sp.]
SYLAYQFQRPFLNDEGAEARRKDFHGRNAKRVRKELASLRGPIMKLGQALSMQSHVLGNEWIEELSGLQMQAPPMHEALMRAQFKGALGKSPEEVFQSFDPAPFAAASLGQVHWATTHHGDEVAVKIQYPAIRDAIENDFKILRTAGLPIQLTGHLQSSVIREVERGILEETDYVHEANNIDFFRKHLADLKCIRVPSVYREFSCDQVLTMSRVPGLRLNDFLKTHPSQELRDQLGIALMRLFFFQLFKVHALHADPHPGNYLLNDDGTIGLVDFGCVKYLKPEVIRCYAQFWSREWVEDRELYEDIVTTLFGDERGAKDPKVRRGMDEIRRFYDKFHPLKQPDQILDFADRKFMDALTQLARTLVSNKFLSPDFLFLSRTESGMCNLLHAIGSRAATTRIVREYAPRNTPRGRKI